MKSLKIVFTFVLIILILFSGGCATKKRAYKDISSGSSAGNTTQGVKAPVSVSGAEEFVYEFDVMVDVDPQKMAEPRPDYPESVPPSETRSADSYGQQSQQSQLTPQPRQSQSSTGAGNNAAGSSPGYTGTDTNSGSSAGNAGIGGTTGPGSAGTTAGSYGSAGTSDSSSVTSGSGTGSTGNAAANWGSAENVVSGSGTTGSNTGTSGSGTGSTGNAAANWGSAGTSVSGGVGVGGAGAAGNTNDYAAEYAAGFTAGFAAGSQNSAAPAGTAADSSRSANTAGDQGFAGNINGSAAYVEGYTNGFAAARRTAGGSGAAAGGVVGVGGSSATGGVGSGTTGSVNAAGISTASSSAAGSGFAGVVTGNRDFGSPGGPGGRERRNTNLVGPGSVNVEGVMDYIKIRNRNPVLNEESTRRIINSFIDEAVKEDVNYDFAIAQMLYWTAFLTHKQRVESNNLAGLQATNEWRGTFPTAEEGVQAHIQHLRGYSHRTLKDPNTRITDPRWNVISDFRGTIKNFEQIYPRWSANTARYRRNIILILNDMYRYSDRYSNLYR